MSGWEVSVDTLNAVKFVFVFCSMAGQQPAALASPRDGEDVAITLGERRVSIEHLHGRSHIVMVSEFLLARMCGKHFCVFAFFSCKQIDVQHF